MPRAPEALGTPFCLEARDQSGTPGGDNVPPFRMGPYAEPLMGRFGAAAGNGRFERGGSDRSEKWERTRDMMAVMLAILAAHDGLESAKRTVRACWAAADDLAGEMCGSSRVAPEIGARSAEAGTMAPPCEEK